MPRLSWDSALVSSPFWADPGFGKDNSWAGGVNGNNTGIANARFAVTARAPCRNCVPPPKDIENPASAGGFLLLRGTGFPAEPRQSRRSEGDRPLQFVCWHAMDTGHVRSGAALEGRPAHRQNPGGDKSSGGRRRGCRACPPVSRAAVLPLAASAPSCKHNRDRCEGDRQRCNEDRHTKS